MGRPLGNSILTDLCRKLREHSTDAETRLWRILRARQVGGAKFRRQHQVGPYIALPPGPSPRPAPSARSYPERAPGTQTQGEGS